MIPEIYTYVDEYGTRKPAMLWSDWENPTLEEKERAAVLAGKKQRAAWLRKAINAMKQAGEWDEACSIIQFCQNIHYTP